MAVTIKNKALTITSLLTRLHDAEKLAGHDFLKKAQELEAAGHMLEITPTTFSITTPEANVLASVSLKIDTVKLAMKGKLGHTSMTTIRIKAKDLVNVAYQKYLDVNLVASVTKKNPKFIDPVEAKAQVMDLYKNGDKVKPIKKLRELTGLGLKEAKDIVEGWIDMGSYTPDPDLVAPKPKVVGKGTPVIDTEADMNAQPVPLKEATKLNQPVCGTSGGSIYHVIALGDSCVVAARIKKNNEIAIRAEVLAHPNSTEGQKVKSGLQFAGLDKKGGGHWSLHLEPEDFAMVKRSIGSTLMAMSIPFHGVTTDLNPIQGAGK
jgi:hypothetical protein